MLTRIGIATLLVAFASVANAGMVEVELIPDNPGPYYGGESLTVDVWLHSQVDYDVGLRRVQFDFTDTDPAILLAPTFKFDYSSIPHDIGGYSATTFPELPVPRTENTLHCICPGMFLFLPGFGSIPIGSIGLALPNTADTYLLDVWNPDEPSPYLGARITAVGLPEFSPTEAWAATTGEISGVSLRFDVVPEPVTFVLLTLGAIAVCRPRRTRRHNLHRPGPHEVAAARWDALTSRSRAWGFVAGKVRGGGPMLGVGGVARPINQTDCSAVLNGHAGSGYNGRAKTLIAQFGSQGRTTC